MEVTIIAGYQANKKYLIPLLLSKVSAGFPSSAENFIDKVLDLNDLLIKHPTATYFIRVKGDSMINAGIQSNDILIVDRALEATNNKIVIARLNDELTIKRIIKENDKIYLMPDNDNYSPIMITEDIDFEIWGVVVFVIHQV